MAAQLEIEMIISASCLPTGGTKTTPGRIQLSNIGRGREGRRLPSISYVLLVTSNLIKLIKNFQANYYLNF